MSVPTLIRSERTDYWKHVVIENPDVLNEVPRLPWWWDAFYWSPVPARMAAMKRERELKRRAWGDETSCCLTCRACEINTASSADRRTLLVGELVFFRGARDPDTWKKGSRHYDYGMIIDDGMSKDNFPAPLDEQIGLRAKRPVVMFFDRDFGTEDVGIYGRMDAHVHGEGVRLGRTGRLVSAKVMDAHLRAWRKFCRTDDSEKQKEIGKKLVKKIRELRPWKEGSRSIP